MAIRTFLDVMNDLDDWNEELAKRTSVHNPVPEKKYEDNKALFKENKTGQLEFVLPKNNTSEEEAE